MKKLFLFILVSLTINGQGQKSNSTFGKDPIINLENWDKHRVYWGYFLGFNSYDFKFDYKNAGQDILVKTTIGFNVGLVGDLRLQEYVNLRFEPGLYYTQRDLLFPDAPITSRLRSVKSTYIHLPLLVKFSSLRTGNVRPYLVGGFSVSGNLSSNESSKEDNVEGSFRMKTWTYNYEIGFGVDLYLHYFKFSPSIRGVFSLNDELVPDKDPNSPWTSNISFMKSRAIFINFTFH